MWALEILMNNYSNRSCVGKDQLFTSVSRQFYCPEISIGKTKASCVICYGLAPVFKLNLLDIVKQTPYVVTSFDDSYSNVIERGQMDVLVRFWDSNVNKVSTRYVNIEFLGKSSAGDVLQKFEDAYFELPKQKCIQISSDGPNVNLKFLNLLNEKRRNECLNELISIGTCGLHTKQSFSKC